MTRYVIMGVEELLFGGSWLDLEVGAVFAMENGCCQGKAGQHQYSPWDHSWRMLAWGDPEPCGKEVGAGRRPVCMEPALSLGDFFC